MALDGVGLGVVSLTTAIATLGRRPPLRGRDGTDVYVAF
jgi:hypothetical protein